MRGIQLLLPLLYNSWAEGSSRSSLGKSGTISSSYYSSTDDFVTREDLDKMQKQLIKEIKRSNFRKSPSRDRKADYVYVVGGASDSKHRSGSYGSSRYGSTTYGTTGRSNTLEIVIKGPPSTEASEQIDWNCYPNCAPPPSASSCYPYCNYAAAPSYKPQTSDVPCSSCGYQQPSGYGQGSYASNSFVAPVAASTRPKTRSFSTQTDALPVVQLVPGNAAQATADASTAPKSTCGSSCAKKTEA